MSLDGVKQNEYIYQNNGTTAQTQGTRETSAPNSVYDVEEAAGSQNTETKQKALASEIDKVLQKICDKLSKYGVTVEDLKKNPLIQKIYETPAEELKKIPKKELLLKKYVECLEAALKDSIVDGKIDYEKANKLSNDYLVAVTTGWTIEGFKKHNKNNHHSLLERLVLQGFLPKGTTIENVSKEELTVAAEKYFNVILNNNKGALLQLQTFGKLLINTPDGKEKEVFLDVVKKLYKENKLKGIEALFQSCRSKEAKAALAKRGADPAYLQELVSEPLRDSEGNIIDGAVSQEDAVAISKIFAENQTEEDRTNAHDNYNAARTAWFEENKEALQAIDKKIQEAAKNGVEPEFTDEEKQILLEQQNFIVGVSSGEFIGTIENINLSKEFIENHLDKLNRDSYDLPSYKDIIKQISNYVEKRPESISLPKEKIAQVLDKATNGNYTKVADSNETTIELNPPAQPKTEPAETPDYGFAARESVDTTRLTFLQQQIKNSVVENREFRVEKNITQPEVKTNTFNAKMAEAGSNQDKLAVIKEFFDKSPLLKLALEKYLTGVTDSLTILNALPTNARKYLAGKLVQKGQLKEDDIQKLNLSYNEKQLLLNKYKETQKQNPVA